MIYATEGFSRIDDLISDQGDIAVVIEQDTHGQYIISAHMDLDSLSALAQDISYSYLTACDISVTKTDFGSALYLSYDTDSRCSIQIPTTASTMFPFSITPRLSSFVYNNTS